MGCARLPAAAVPARFVPFAPGDEGPSSKLEHMSRWFPKMIITQPVDPELVSRDPQVVDRMNRDCLCWRSGYRARVLAEVAREMSEIADNICMHAEVFVSLPSFFMAT